MMPSSRSLLAAAAQSRQYCGAAKWAYEYWLSLNEGLVMLRSFEERERAAELIYVHSEEMRFANHIAGIRAVAAFAVRMLGLDGMTSEAYAQALIAARIEGLRPDALLERVQADLAANGVEVSLAELRAELDRASAQRNAADGRMPDLTPARN
ncbi:DUF1476 domain-containing protein [Methylobacterium sp. CM6257]|jgi:hypothetical protein